MTVHDIPWTLDFSKALENSLAASVRVHVKQDQAVESMSTAKIMTRAWNDVSMQRKDYNAQ